MASRKNSWLLCISARISIKAISWVCELYDDAWDTQPLSMMADTHIILPIKMACISGFFIPALVLVSSFTNLTYFSKSICA